MATENPSESEAKGARPQGTQARQQQPGEKEQGTSRQPTGMVQREARPPARAGIERLLSLSPFGLMRQMMEGMDRLIEEPGLGRRRSTRLAAEDRREAARGGRTEEALWIPNVEVLEREGRLIIRADLPGASEADLRVEVLDDVLVIEGERRMTREEEEGDIWRSELTFGAFRRAIPLPEGVDVEDITANLENGVLELSMKLPEQRRQPKRVEVGGRGAGKEKRPESNVH